MEKKAINLEEEERCGHMVTVSTKKLWNIELELADQLERICKKHGLRYFAGGGTLLGAVRHQGFIPWDDDMDFFMPFEDYRKLQEVAPKELQYPYAFQDYHNTDDCGSRFSRIRKSDTTGCTQAELRVVPPHNLGVFIDIFPLFYVPEGKLGRKLQYLRIRFLGDAMSGSGMVQRRKFNGTMRLRGQFNPQILTYRLMSLFMNHKELCEAYLNACDYRTTSYWGITSFLPGQDKYVWKTEWFQETIELPFENRMIPCPKEYDQILTHQFGNWHKMIKGSAIHSVGVIDPDTPYWITFKERFGELHEVPEETEE